MGASGNTTERENDSVEAVPRKRLWLRWVLPAAGAPERLEHELVLGRDSECGARLGGEGVSRRHAQFYRQGPIFAIKDLGSTNGTFLNGKRIQHGPVASGFVLRIGSQVGIFCESVDTPAGLREVATGLFAGPELSTALEPMRRAATSNISIVIVGATGTGKERVARGVHELSGRKGSFQALNCAALPRDLAEAELFGYRKGSFTGAERPSLGYFRAANRGTLFLDEIAELPLAVQAKLLRALEEGTVTPLGETEPVSIDVRVVVAAQQSLGALVAAKSFRQDLLGRLAGLTVDLPPLCARIADVPSLFEHFLNHYSGGHPPPIEPKLVEALCLYDWPGNVRELEQVARQMLAVHGLEPVLKRSFLPAEFSHFVAPDDASIPPLRELGQRRDHDRLQLALALKQAQNNVTAAAALAGFSRQRAYRLLDGASADEFVTQQLSESIRASGSA